MGKMIMFEAAAFLVFAIFLAFAAIASGVTLPFIIRIFDKEHKK